MKSTILSKMLVLVPLLAVALMCGCEGVNASFWAIEKTPNGVYGPQKNPSEVELFITQRPSYKYKEVGIITFETFSAYNYEASIYQIMRERAAKAGVDGIIIMNAQEFRSSPAFAPYPRTRRGHYDRYAPPDMYRYRATAIMKIK